MVLGSTKSRSHLQALPVLAHSLDSFVQPMLWGTCSVPGTALGPRAQQGARQAWFPLWAPCIFWTSMMGTACSVLGRLPWSRLCLLQQGMQEYRMRSLPDRGVVSYFEEIGRQTWRNTWEQYKAQPETLAIEWTL